MDKFSEKYNLPRLNQDEREKMNGPIRRTEIETVIKKNFQQTKVQDQMASQVNSTITTKMSLYPSSLNFFKRLKKKEHSQRHSMRPPSPSFQNQTKIPPKRIL